SILFADDISAQSAADVMTVFDDVPSTEIPAAEFGGDGLGLVDVLTRVQLAPSKGEARRLVQSGGVDVNNRRGSGVQQRLRLSDTTEGRVLVLRKGAKQNHVIRIADAIA